MKNYELCFKLYIDGKVDFQRVDGSKPDTKIPLDLPLEKGK
jgi:hypothetical protein